MPERVRREKLKYPDAPETLLYILDHFYKLKGAAQSKISYSEMKSYIDIMRLDMQIWECELVMKIDSIYEGAKHGN